MRRIDKRRQIMHAAEKLFTNRWIHEITTDDIAREARVGKGTIYRCFKDKNELFFEIATSGFEELRELLKQDVPQGISFSEQLVNACAKISSFFRKRHELFRMMQTQDNQIGFFKSKMLKRWKKNRKLLVSAIGEIIRRGVEEGDIRDDIQVDILANFLLGMLKTRSHDLEDFPRAMQGFEILIDLFTNGARRK